MMMMRMMNMMMLMMMYDDDDVDDVDDIDNDHGFDDNFNFNYDGCGYYCSLHYWDTVQLFPEPLLPMNTQILQGSIVLGSNFLIWISILFFKVIIKNKFIRIKNLGSVFLKRLGLYFQILQFLELFLPKV